MNILRGFVVWIGVGLCWACDGDESPERNRRGLDVEASGSGGTTGAASDGAGGGAGGDGAGGEDSGGLDGQQTDGETRCDGVTVCAGVCVFVVEANGVKSLCADGQIGSPCAEDAPCVAGECVAEVVGSGVRSVCR